MFSQFRNASTAIMLAGALAVTALATGAAQATILQMNSGVGGADNGSSGEGEGRGIGFLANSSFNIDSVGIKWNLVQQSYDAQIFASTNGSDLGAQLASASAIVGGAGDTNNDIAINFSFNAGSHYVLIWSPTDLGDNDWSAGTTVDAYFFDSSLPATNGPVTLINGFEGNGSGTGGGFDNSLHPNMYVNIVDVPEAATLALFGLGLAGLGVTVRRRKTA